MKDDNLKDLYNEIYLNNKSECFSKYRGQSNVALDHDIAIQWIKRHARSPVMSILDFGCGEGEFLNNLPVNFDRTGIDFSEQAIINAEKNNSNIKFVVGSDHEVEQMDNKFTVVTSFGVLEHVRDPRSTLDVLLKSCVSDGLVILSCPSFLNIRGVIWMTLQMLFDVPMSLADKHFITPVDIEKYLVGSGKKIEEIVSVDNDLSQGDYFYQDMTKRLTNALNDANMPSANVHKLVQWVEENRHLFASNDMTGANMVYLIR